MLGLMDTVEMRLLTVPQFARRVHHSIDEVLTMIACRDVKALRPNPEEGYRVLETEVDRILQEKTTRIKRPSANPQDHATVSEQAPSRQIGLEVHLTTVTALEAIRETNARLERLNTQLQAELFHYRRLLQCRQDDLLTSQAHLKAAKEQILVLEAQLDSATKVEHQKEATLPCQAETRSTQERDAVFPTPWWRRLFQRKAL